MQENNEASLDKRDRGFSFAEPYKMSDEQLQQNAAENIKPSIFLRDNDDFNIKFTEYAKWVDDGAKVSFRNCSNRKSMKQQCEASNNQ